MVRKNRGSSLQQTPNENSPLEFVQTSAAAPGESSQTRSPWSTKACPTPHTTGAEPPVLPALRGTTDQPPQAPAPPEPPQPQDCRAATRP